MGPPPLNHGPAVGGTVLRVSAVRPRARGLVFDC